MKDGKLKRILKTNIYTPRTSREERSKRWNNHRLRNALIGACSLFLIVVILIWIHVFYAPFLNWFSNVLAVAAILLFVVGAYFSVRTLLNVSLWLRKEPKGKTDKRRSGVALGISAITVLAFVTILVHPWHLNVVEQELSWMKNKSFPATFESGDYTWEKQPADDNFFNAISGTDANHIWAAGATGTWFYDGKKWSPVIDQNGNWIMGTETVFALDGKDVWAVGEWQVFFFDGKRWTTMALPSEPNTRIHQFPWSVTALSKSQVFIVGYPFLYSFDVKKWKKDELNQFDEYLYVSSKKPASVWVSGRDSFLELTVNGWRRMPNPGLRAPLSIAVGDSSHVWTTGETSVYMYEGTGWQKQLEMIGGLVKVYSADGRNAWATRDSGYKSRVMQWYVYHYDGSRWKLASRSPAVEQKQVPFSFGYMPGIYSPDPYHVWVVGDVIYMGTRKK